MYHLNYLYCIICYSYSAGCLEKYSDKSLVNVGALKVLFLACTNSATYDQALTHFTRYSRYCRGEHKYILQAKDRLTKQPECYKIIKNLDKVELPSYEYREKFEDREFRFLSWPPWRTEEDELSDQVDETVQAI